MSPFKKQTRAGGGSAQSPQTSYEQVRNLNIAENTAKMIAVIGNATQEFDQATAEQGPAKKPKKVNTATIGQPRQSKRNRKQIEPAKEDGDDSVEEDSGNEDSHGEKQSERNKAHNEIAEGDEESDDSDSEDQPQTVKNFSKAVASSLPTFKSPSTTANAQDEDASGAEIVNGFETPPQKAEPKTTTTNPRTPENEDKNIERGDKLLNKFLDGDITTAEFKHLAEFIPGMKQRHSTFFEGEGQVRGFLNNTFSRALHWFVALPFQKPFANLTCSFCFSQAGRQHRTRFG
jgi:hypothetical protein